MFKRKYLLCLVAVLVFTVMLSGTAFAATSMQVHPEYNNAWKADNYWVSWDIYVWGGTSDSYYCIDVYHGSKYIQTFYNFKGDYSNEYIDDPSGYAVFKLYKQAGYNVLKKSSGVLQTITRPVYKEL